MEHSSEYRVLKSGLEIIDTDKRRRHDLNALLNSWVSLVNHTYEVTGGAHAPYSYKEQTNVGVLAGAAINVGWVALEECAFNKSAGADEGSDGRVDLSIWTTEGQRYLMEAKLTVRSVDTLGDRIKVVVGNAKEDAGKLRSEIDATRYAVVFVIPRFSAKADAASVEDGIDEAIAMCRNERADFFAYTFPGRVDRKASDRMDSDQTAYGIIVLGYRDEPTDSKLATGSI